MSMIDELKRRSVFKVGAGYVVIAWLAIQVGTSVLPIYGTPDWFLRAFVLVLLLGFPVALVLAWLLEVTPEGVKVDTGPVGNKRMYVVAAVLAALALGWYFHGMQSAPKADLGNARSIAVLPFLNMSGDKDNEYFSDGISEEILNVLAEVPELKVAARTSSFSFRGSKEEVPQIAHQLGVRMVLEGSVRKQGDRVRITAQLIDSSTGFHVWSQTYDRELKDIFAIQDEIAKSIGEELKLRVAGEGSAGRRGTQNLEAYDLYLRGVAQWQLRTDKSLWVAKETLERSIAADPKFAQAWCGLALVYAVLPEYTAKITHEQATALGRAAAERALVLDPSLPEPYAALGQFERYAQNQATALALTERALALRPSFATAHHWLGTILVPSGEIERGLAASKRATELDPRSVIDASNYASMLMIAGRNADAIAACTPMLDYAPDSILCPPILGMIHLGDGNLDEARRYYRLFVAKWSPQAGGIVDTVFDALAGHGDRHAIAVKLSDATIEQWNDPDSGMPFSNLDIPAMLVLLGENELVFHFIARQAPSTFSTLAWIMLAPVMDPVRCDPRFQEPLNKAGLRDLRAEKLCKGKP
jgi:TolB-like protein/Tfp pilus assembly protein PilF